MSFIEQAYLEIKQSIQVSQQINSVLTGSISAAHIIGHTKQVSEI